MNEQTYELNEFEADTVIVALRLMQTLLRRGRTSEDDLVGYLGTLPLLSGEKIDALCDRIRDQRLA